MWAAKPSLCANMSVSTQVSLVWSCVYFSKLHNVFLGHWKTCWLCSLNFILEIITLTWTWCPKITDQFFYSGGRTKPVKFNHCSKLMTFETSTFEICYEHWNRTMYATTCRHKLQQSARKIFFSLLSTNFWVGKYSLVSTDM